jgi:hypothetical protein
VVVGAPALSPSPFTQASAPPRAEPVGQADGYSVPPQPQYAPVVPPPAYEVAPQAMAVAPAGQVYVAPPSRSPCIDTACNYMGPLACTTIDELQAVASLCGSQYGASCLRTVCEFAGELGCTQFDEVAYATESCAGDVDGSCVDTVCRRLGPLGCSTLFKAARVARACAR